MMRVLVCGGRDYPFCETVYFHLGKMHRAKPITAILQGGARGIDAFAKYWAKRRGIPCEQWDADWRIHGRRAGPMRNKRMLEEGHPDVVVAFPGGRGTADMVRQARRAGVEVVEIADGP